MALKACQECGTQISTSAASCPKCGAPNLPPKKRDAISSLARWFIIIFVIIPIGIGLFIGVYQQQTHERAVPDTGSTVAVSGPKDCRVSDIGLDKITGRMEEYSIKITGRLLNNCAMPTGVQLKVTIYDKGGAVLAVEDPWPASTNNIPAHTDFPFEVIFMKTKGLAKYDVRVIDVRSWTR
jgi:ribosomal protein L40E